MKYRAVVFTLSAAALVAVVLISGCSSSDSNKVTNPPSTTEPFESGDLSHNGSFQHTFATAGSFNYRCRHHVGMTGSITVTASASDSQLVTFGDNFFPAPASAIKPGGHIRWINGGNNTHTVTRP